MEQNDIESQARSQSTEQEKLAGRLREAREYLGLSQEFIAEQLGISSATVSAIEMAKRKVSSLELKQLARLYCRNYDHLLNGDSEPTETEEAIASLFQTTKQLSATDKEQVLRFAQFLEQAGGPPRPKNEVGK